MKEQLVEIGSMLGIDLVNLKEINCIASIPDDEIALVDEKINAVGASLAEEKKVRVR